MWLKSISVLYINQKVYITNLDELSDYFLENGRKPKMDGRTLACTDARHSYAPS